ncbi:MAG: fumarylacetoacetate hydrolase family protein [Robiginitomaculum sp.]|nr:fumarylacetoacetate hydrolase family protein [Robiginitomaculum sp.]
MKFRKHKTANSNELQVFRGETWETVPINSALFSDFLTATGQSKTDYDPADIKSFVPKSYRDFMLFEQHFINAATSFAKANKPGAYKVAKLYQKLTGKLHPKLKPAPLWYQEPIYYMGNHLNFFGEGENIVWPKNSKIMDYELELGFVLAKPLYNATPDEAEAAIGGFVVFNDFSARDRQMAEMQSGFGPQKSKHFANAISAEFVTANEILPRINQLTGTVGINGRQIAEVSSKGMGYTLGEALSHVSQGERLFPGEFFGTGTLPGGCGLESGTLLSKGDEVTISIEGIGSLTNTIG